MDLRLQWMRTMQMCLRKAWPRCVLIGCERSNYSYWISGTDGAPFHRSRFKTS